MRRSLSILLADHEDVTLDTIGTHLRAFGHQVDEAHDGPAALSAIQTNKYDIVLLAAVLPKMDGLSVLAHARESCPETPIVLLIEQGTAELGIQAVRLGVMDILTKPIKMFELEAVLDKAAQVVEHPQPPRGGNASDKDRSGNPAPLPVSPNLVE